MLLILTSNRDFSADYLIVYLLDRGLPYFRLNAEDLTHAELGLELEKSDTHKSIALGSKYLDLHQVRSVWYRRVLQPSPNTSLTLSERAFVAGEIRHLATGLVLNSNVTWVNPIEKVALAEHKLYQLRLAQQLGLAIPRSIVSRNPRRLREFISKSQFGAICKPIFHGLFFDESGQYSIYTRRVSADAFSGDTLEICPVFLQEEIPRQADVRITFIGSTFFTVDILGREGLVDWRAPDSEANFHVSTVSEAVISRCQLMLQTLGLRYGAFDFIRTPDGRLVFLEINPTGEWAWLEDILALPMRESFVRLLYDETP